MNAEPISVIIIESQPLMRKALSTTLASDGLNVVAELASNIQALEIASKLNPALILFSINTSTPEELGVLKSLREALPKAIIVALITGEFPGQEQAARIHGAHIVLTKSSPRSELLGAIRRTKKHRLSTNLSIS